MTTRTRPLSRCCWSSPAQWPWLRSLDEDDFAASSVLAGWSVRQLITLVFARTLHESLNRTTVERPLPVHVYVQGYRPNADQIADASRSAAEADDVVSALDAEIERCAEALAAGPAPSVALGPRGPIAG